MSLTFVAPQEAMAHMPPDTVRVQVREEDGTLRWKPVDQVLETDAVCFQNGSPVTMKSKPGRPRRAGAVAPPPGISSAMGQPIASQITQAHERKKKAVTANHVYQQVCLDPYDDKLLALIMKDLAEEAAALKFERKRADQTGKDPIALSVRRVATLQSIVDTWFKRRDQIASKLIDMKSPAFRRLFQYLVQTFCECMEEAGVEEATSANVTLELSRRIKDDPTWEDGAKEVMRNV